VVVQLRKKLGDNKVEPNHLSMNRSVCSADWQSAVSRVGNPQGAAIHSHARRLPISETATRVRLLCVSKTISFNVYAGQIAF